MTESPFNSYAEAIFQHFNDLVDQAGRDLKVPQAVAYEGIRNSLKALLATRAADADARNAFWRARVRLYNCVDLSTVQADSDEGTPETAAGSEVVKGLGGVCRMLQECAIPWHANERHESTEGLDTLTLEHKVKSLRPTLSRRGGNATWRVYYKANGADWLGRVDVERVK